MLFSAAAAHRMLKIEQMYDEVKDEFNESLVDKGMVTYHFSALFTLLPTTLRDKYPPPLGLVLTPPLLEKIDEIVPWDFQIIDKPDKPVSYIAVSAHLEKELAVNTLKCCLEQKGFGVVQRVGSYPDSIIFKQMEEFELEKFLEEYKFSRDY